MHNNLLLKFYKYTVYDNAILQSVFLCIDDAISQLAVNQFAAAFYDDRASGKFGFLFSGIAENVNIGIHIGIAFILTLVARYSATENITFK
jgi:hypothetical protein